MNYKRNPYELNLVFLGGFNPFIFHPEWFRKIGLFSDQEIDASYEGGIWQDKDGNNNIINFTQFISPGISTIKISDIDIRVEPKRFQILTLDETKFEQLRDVAFGVFKILEYTPISALGVNVRAHYNMGKEEVWHSLGHLLAPKEPWGGILEDPLMKSITLEGVNPFSENGAIRITIEPSSHYKFGVFIQINHHFSFPDSTDSSEAVDAIKSHTIDIAKKSFEKMNLILKNTDKK